MEIFSFRVWVGWADGDWTAETRQSFESTLLTQIDKKIERGAAVYPWPKSRSPGDNWKRIALRAHHMTEWIDPEPNIWLVIPQVTRNKYDQDVHIPDERNDLFTISINDDLFTSDISESASGSSSGVELAASESSLESDFV